MSMSIFDQDEVSMLTSLFVTSSSFIMVLSNSVDENKKMEDLNESRLVYTW